MFSCWIPCCAIEQCTFHSSAVNCILQLFAFCIKTLYLIVLSSPMSYEIFGQGYYSNSYKQLLWVCGIQHTLWPFGALLTFLARYATSHNSCIPKTTWHYRLTKFPLGWWQRGTQSPPLQVPESCHPQPCDLGHSQITHNSMRVSSIHMQCNLHRHRSYSMTMHLEPQS